MVPLPTSAEHGSTDYDRSDYAGKIGKQASWDCVSRLFDTHCSEINRRHVKRGFGASINRRRGETDNVVRPKPMHDVGQPGECRASAERTHYREREKVRRKMQRRQDWRKHAT